MLSDRLLGEAHRQREVERVRRALDSGGWLAVTDHAVAVVRLLPWDTEHFGVSCADLVRLYVAPGADPLAGAPLVDEILAKARHQGVRLLSARILAGQTFVVQRLQRAGALLVDTSVEIGTAATSLPELPAGSGAVCVGVAAAEHAAPLQAIAKTFVDNRFHRDPGIAKDKARGVYTRWVQSALDAAQLLVATVDGQVAGFASVARAPTDDPLQVGVIGLVIINPAYRGHGVFDPLMLACRRHLDVQPVVSSTQVSNVRALRAFARHGLLPLQARHILHCWL